MTLKHSLKRILPRSLFGRSLMIIIVPVLLLQLFTVFMFFDRHWAHMTDRLNFALAGEITVIVQRFEQGLSAEEQKRLIEQAAEHLEILITVHPDQKTLILQEQIKPAGHLVAHDFARHLEDQLRRPFTLFIDDSRKKILLNILLQGNQGMIEILTPSRRLTSSSGYIFLLWMVGGSILLFTIALIFLRNQIKPIRRLAVAAERFGKGRDVMRFKLEGATEVRRAGQAFLTMRDRLKRQIDQRTAFLSGVSHDLRTPLTRLKLQLAMLDETDDTRAMAEDIADMEKMLEGYLAFARGEGGEKRVRFDLSSLVQQVINKYQSSSFNINFQCEVAQSSYFGMHNALERAIVNLVTNAARYSTQLSIILREDSTENAYRLIFEDNGPGIPAKHYEDVLRPFFRIEKSRNSETGGIGLGLAIVQDIIHAHGGEITLGQTHHALPDHKCDHQNEQTRGLRVEITLPQ